MIPGIVASQQLLTQGDGGDGLFAFVSLLTSWDGTDGATTATDDSQFAHTPTFQDAAQIDTAQSVFGGSSLLIGTASDLVRWPNHSSFQIGIQPFCFETRVRFTTLTSNRHLFGVWDTSGGSPEKSWRIVFRSLDGGILFNYSEDGSVEQTAALIFGLATNTWYDVCYERDEANNLRAYLDGVMLDKVTGFNADIFDSVKDLFFGCQGDNSNFLSGWMDETRIIIGASVYASDAGYTPAAAPFPRS